MSWTPEEVARIVGIEGSLEEMKDSITRIESALVGYQGTGGLLNDVSKMKDRLNALETERIQRDAIDKNRAAKWGAAGGIGGSLVVGVILLLLERAFGA